MTDNSTAPLILVDGSSYLFRAFHALPPLTNSKGNPTGAIYGVANMLRKLLSTYSPTHVGVIFDPKGKTFRHEMYKDYKANRPPMDEDLRCQIKPLFSLIEAMGFPLIIVDGVEADDVIGTFARLATLQNRPCLVSTGDKDMAQLVNDHITLVNTMTDQVLDTQGVIDKFGVKPEQIIDYLALMGDKVDNIPGVPKVGPKTAVKWLAEYGTLDAIMANADAFKGKIGENLRGALDSLPLSKELTTIKTDVELKEQLDDLALKPANQDQLLKLLKEFEFKSWLSQVLNESGSDVSESVSRENTAPTSQAQYQCVTTIEELNQWVEKIKQHKKFIFDTETTSLNAMQARIVGVSLATDANEAAYIPFGHDYLGVETQLTEEQVLGGLKPLLESPTIEVIGQNLKYDMKVLANHDISLQGIASDTMLESYVLDSSTRNDMDSLALKYLGRNTIHFEDVAGKGKNQLTFNQIPLEEATPYAAEDAEITLLLHETLSSKLKQDEKLQRVLNEIELPLVPILSKMERTGVLVDSALLDKQSKALTLRLLELEKETFALAGDEFNLNSPKQLQAILFDKLNLPVISKTPKGQPSTAENVLQELALEYELPQLILEYRSLSKLKSTYTDKLPKQVEPTTGRIHTSYHQAVTATGRLSSSDPNLQNIPIRTEQGRQIRQAFIAPKGYKLVAADYSQIELRIMAHLSQDKTLLDAFANNADIHSITASEVFGVPFDEVDKEQRRRAKAINFGLIYGMSPFGLAKQLGIERSDASEYVDTYFKRYPGVKQYMDDTRQMAHKQGFVETLFGRRLYLPEINAKNKMRQQAAERTAINAPMQGTAADIIKRAMISMDSTLANSSLDIRMIMQVHDELVFEVKENEVEQACDLMKNQMESAATLDVPLLVEVGVGSNWDEAH